MKKLIRRIILSKVTKSIIYVLLLSITYYHTKEILVSAFSNAAMASNVLDAIFVSFLITFMYAIPEKLGLAIDLKESVSTQLGTITNKVASMLYSKTVYGLTGIDPNFTEIGIIENLQHGDRLLWMNTRLAHLDNYKSLFVDAANRGAVVRLLLMDTNAETAKFRWQEAFSDENESNYTNRLETQRQSLDTINRKKYKNDGAIKVKYYSDLPCVPIMILIKENGHKVAFTGYYLNRASGQTPYLEWETSPKQPLVNEFESYFFRKWDSVGDEIPFGIDAARNLMRFYDSKIENNLRYAELGLVEKLKTKPAYKSKTWVCYKLSTRKPGFVLKSSMEISFLNNEYFRIIDRQFSSSSSDVDGRTYEEISEGVGFIKTSRLWCFMRETKFDQPRAICFDNFDSAGGRVSRVFGHVSESDKKFTDNHYSLNIVIVDSDLDREMWTERNPGEPYDITKQQDLFSLTENGKTEGKFEAEKYVPKFALDYLQERPVR